MLRLPENVRSTLRTLSAFKDAADRLRVPLPAGAVATTRSPSGPNADIDMAQRLSG
jgi:hypothetical protein